MSPLWKSSNIPTYTPLHTIWVYYICNSHRYLELLFTYLLTCWSISAPKQLEGKDFVYAVIPVPRLGSGPVHALNKYFMKE